jgi:O-antigen/teichoic acid export membrane protein
VVQQAGVRIIPSLDLFMGIQLTAMGIMACWSWIEVYWSGKSSSYETATPSLQHEVYGTRQNLLEVGKAMWSFNRWTASANLGQLVVYRFQYFVMMAMLGSAELGIYSVAVAVAEGVWVITQSYSTVLLSSLSSCQGPTDPVLFRRSWRWSLQALLWTVLPMGVLVLLPVSCLHWALGTSYGPVHELWIAMTPGVLALAFSNVLVQHFTAIGKVKVSFVSSWGNALLIIAGLGPALQMAGAEGIACWTSVVLVLNALGIMAYFRKSCRAYL